MTMKDELLSAVGGALLSDAEIAIKSDKPTKKPEIGNVRKITPEEQVLQLLEDVLKIPSDSLDRALLQELEDVLKEGQNQDWAEFKDINDNISGLYTTLKVVVTEEA